MGVGAPTGASHALQERRDCARRVLLEDAVVHPPPVLDRDPENTAARALYESFGFFYTGEVSETGDLYMELQFRGRP